MARFRGRLTLYYDVEVDEPGEDPETDIALAVRNIMDQEHTHQLAGRERDPQTDHLWYGLTLRLPGNFVVTGFSTGRGYNDADNGIVGEAPRRFRVIKGESHE